MLIGITGKKRSGKDTCAQHLMNTWNYRRYSLAYPIKEMLVPLFRHLGCLTKDPEEAFEVFRDREIAELGGVTGRVLAQTLGTEWGRNVVSEDIWVTLLEMKIREDHSGVRDIGIEKIVVSDIRFDNEARWINSLGGVVVKVVNLDDDTRDGHASEAGVSRELVHETVSAPRGDVPKLLAELDSVVSYLGVKR